MTAGRPPEPIEEQRALARGDGRTPGGRKVPPDVTPGKGLALHRVTGGIDHRALPRMPKTLTTPLARREWYRLWETGSGWLRPEADYRWVAFICEAYQDIQLFRDRVSEDGLMIKNYADVMVANPLLATIAQREQVIMKCLQELGFSPRARAALGLAELKRQTGLADLQARTTGGR
jgi:P27 family predicted phage terminase small subunit